MLYQQTVEKLFAMKLNGMAEAVEEQRQQPRAAELSFEDRLAILVERQWLWRESRALTAKLRYAALKYPNACIEDIDYRHERGLDRAVIDQLRCDDWLRYHRNCIITGPTGSGKTYLACALVHNACRQGHRGLYYYCPKLFRALRTARLDGSLVRLLKKLRRVQLLLIDDWGMERADPELYRLFLEVIDDRHGVGSTLITSQYKVDAWHDLVPEAPVADAILDRLVHNAHRIDLLAKKSMRETRSTELSAENGTAGRPADVAPRQ